MKGDWILHPVFKIIYDQIEEISSLTLFDNVTITASYYYIAEDHFNCGDKKKKLIDRVGLEKAEIIMKAQNGCDTVRHKPRFTIDGIHYHRCVCAFRTSRLGYYLDLLEKLGKGILPHEGSYLEQPAKTIEILNRLDFIKNDIEIRQIEKARKKSEREQRIANR